MMAVAEVAAHSGQVRERTHPELYDIVTFALAVASVILVRRALRARFARKRVEPPKD
jgi:hypothetical protein